MRTILWLLLAASSLLVLRSRAETPTAIVDASSMYKGAFGEALVDEFYLGAGRTDVLGKWHPNGTGPDRIFRLPDGRLEVHEVKAYQSWAGKEAMKADVGGQQLYELSDDWLEQWERRTLSSPHASTAEKQLASEIKQARANGKLVRVYDEIHLTEGQWRSSNVHPSGKSSVVLDERTGPVKIDRMARRYEEHIAKFEKLRLRALEAKNKAMRQPRLSEFEKPPSAWGDYDKLGKKRFGKCAVKPGLFTADGRLVVAGVEGGAAGLMVFGLDAGHAYYDFAKGNIYKPEFEKRLMDAAVKGTAVGGATAVAVFLGATPAGWVVLGVGIGAYCITDAVMTEWHRQNDKRYLNRSDLAHFGIEMNSVLDIRDPGIALNVENWK
jgi:hypothetical protein